jgi:osmotically-inducible protein OsmY
MKQRQVIGCILVLITLLYLQGCVNAAVTGAQAVYDHHGIQQSFNDHYIKIRAYQTIYAKSNRYKDTHVSVATFNQVALLTGQTPSLEQKIEIERLVKKIPGVKEVYNRIEVAQPISSLISMSDSWITTKIKSRMMATGGVEPSQIKVVTENGTVYLMGIISPSQASVAVQIARTTTGVQSVVKIFAYLRISKT